MAKSQKKKDQKSKGDQQSHCRATRGINTSRRGPVWAKRQYKKADGTTGIQEIQVPPGSQWNPERMSKKSRENGLPEPFDALHLEWDDELREYADEVNGKVERTNLPGDRYNYALIVKDEAGDDKVLFEIESSQNLNFGPRKKFKKKAGKPRKDS